MPPWTAAEALDLIAKGEASPLEVFDVYAAAIEAQEPSIRAFVTLDIERARDGVLAKQDLPLRGLPVAIKDLIDTADFPTAYGSPIYAGHQPEADAWIVQRLRSLGASIIGKSVTTEFAFLNPGPTRNPADPGRTPGGSSSGSAAAVAAGMVPFAVGTQTAGSVIRPASFCGAAALKPSYGRLPMDGVKPLAPSLDTLGLFAASAGDASWLFEQLTGIAPAPATEERPVRVGVVRTDFWSEAAPEMQVALLAMADRAATSGAEVTELTLADAGKPLDTAQMTVMQYESGQALAREAAGDRDRISPILRDYLDGAARISEAEYRGALEVLKAARQAMRPVFEEQDLLLAPSAPGPAPLGFATTGSPLFNRMWTALHGPCFTTPVPGAAPPLGVQWIAAPGGEAGLTGAMRDLGLLGAAA